MQIGSWLLQGGGARVAGVRMAWLQEGLVGAVI